MYGYFECDDCENQWESARVYRRKGGDFYGQECRDCGLMCYPYKTEETTCSKCGEEARSCDCVWEDNEPDPDKPHRSDLCEKCRLGRPCGQYKTQRR